MQVVPFLLEDKLKELGAVLQKADADWGELVVTDGNLITGQNPGECKWAAMHLGACTGQDSMQRVPSHVLCGCMMQQASCGRLCQLFWCIGRHWAYLGHPKKACCAQQYRPADCFIHGCCMNCNDPKAAS